MEFWLLIRFPTVLSRDRIYKGSHAVADESRREHFTEVSTGDEISITSQCLKLNVFQQKNFAHHRICDKKYSIILHVLALDDSELNVKYSFLEINHFPLTCYSHYYYYYYYRTLIHRNH